MAAARQGNVAVTVGECTQISRGQCYALGFVTAWWVATTITCSTALIGTTVELIPLVCVKSHYFLLV